MERRTHATYLAVCAGMLPMPLFFYYPLEHRWELTEKPSGLAMDFYGRIIFATAVSIPSALATRWIFGRWGQPSEKLRTIFLGGAAIALAGVMALYGWELYWRVPKALPLPADYRPR